MDRSEALVSVEWLAQNLGDPRIRVVDVRWFLPSTGRAGQAEFLAGHLPSATFVDLDRDLAGPIRSHGGRHPLPDPGAFASVLGSCGIGPATHVVAYDDSAGSTAARLWWMLRQIGHAAASVLDGGIARWRAEGHPIEIGEPRPQREETYPTSPFGGFGRTVARDEILPALDGGAILLDARAPDRFEGRLEPIDPRAGHIPGARNAPFQGNLTSTVDGVSTFLQAHELRDRFERIGAGSGSRVILSCGSGVTACHNALAMYLAGLEPPTVYVGSWSDWSSNADLPIETGPGDGPNG